VSAAAWLAVAALGGVGAVLRFVVDRAVSARAGRSFPYGTLVVNVSGAVVLGFLAGLPLGADGYLLAGTALLGSYTTFSTWMYETQRMVEDGESVAPALNLAVSLVLGLAAAALGRAVGGLL
jgi:fluoride exporter